MNGFMYGIDVGRKNMVFGMVLFLLLGIAVGTPLTIDFFGGSVLSSEQYQTWKVIHGYGIFLAFINYFFGLVIDRLTLTSTRKEIASWSFIIAAAFGGLGRMGLALLSVLGAYGVYASLGEVLFITLGTLLFLSGQLQSPRTAAALRHAIE